MDLSTTYLGFRLPHPIMPGASPLVDNLDTVRRLEDAGAAAIVMHSLFEEQLGGDDPAARALRPGDFVLDPEGYLEQIRRIKRMVSVPVIASLNGVTPGGWLDYAGRIAQAGADALELNVYYLAADPGQSAADVECRLLDMVQAVKRAVSIPIAVKLGPYYSSFANLAVALDERGADGLILFNRFHQPDLDLDAGGTVPGVLLSGPEDLPLRLRWLALLRGRVRASLAATGGIHGSQDALKAVMAGADAVQVVSVLLRNGPGYLRSILDGMEAWLEKRCYASLSQARGALSMKWHHSAQSFERSSYVRALQSWRTGPDAPVHPRSGVRRDIG